MSTDGGHGQRLASDPPSPSAEAALGVRHEDDSSASALEPVDYKVGEPLEIGWRLPCRWEDDTEHLCVILDRRKPLPEKRSKLRRSQITGTPPSRGSIVSFAAGTTHDVHGPRQHEYEYYVHFVNFNSRLDGWVDFSKLDTSRAGRPKLSLDEGKKKRGAMKSYRKRKREDGTEEDEDEELKMKNILSVQMGKHELETWYFSPYPNDVLGISKDGLVSKLFICEYCLRYMASEVTLRRHLRKCPHYYPPGDEIYRDGALSVFEVDGRSNKAYCQSLCLLAKLFLDHKTLYYDVDPFLFYILTEHDERGCHFLGYFSKEKESPGGYNLACIMTLPCYQQRGYGRFLIDFSYELSRRDGKMGTPERPLSDLGVVSYRSYWKQRILEYLEAQQKQTNTVSISNISQETMIMAEDIVQTMQSMGMIQMFKGQHVIVINPDNLAAHSKTKKSGPRVDPSKVQWNPPRSIKEKQARRQML